MNKKGLITIGTAIVLMLSTPFLGTGFVNVMTQGQIHEAIEAIPEMDTALVLGAAAYGDRLSDILRDRVETAIELYEADKVSVLIMSGAPNETEAMEKYALERGVPATAIKQDPEGLNTLASVKNIAKNGQSVIIVTQRYHLPRALFVANSLGLKTAGMTADRSQYIKMFEFKSREIFATSKAIMDLYLTY